MFLLGFFFWGGAEKLLFVVILEIGKAKFLPSWKQKLPRTPPPFWEAAGGDADVAANQLLAERLIEWKKIS